MSTTSTPDIAAAVDRMMAQARTMVTTTDVAPAPAGTTATRERRTAIVDHRHTILTTSADHRRTYEEVALPQALALKSATERDFAADHARGDHDGIYVGSCPTCRHNHAIAQGWVK